MKANKFRSKACDFPVGGIGGMGVEECGAGVESKCVSESDSNENGKMRFHAAELHIRLVKSDLCN
jgi:hypothetical protein